MSTLDIIRSLVKARLAEVESGSYGNYPSGQGYGGGLDRPLREPNPSVANPPRSADSPAPERSGKELLGLFKTFPGSTDQFYKGLSPGEIENFDIHRDSEVRKGLGQPPIGGSSNMPPSISPPKAPSVPSTDDRLY